MCILLSSLLLIITATSKSYLTVKKQKISVPHWKEHIFSSVKWISTPLPAPKAQMHTAVMWTFCCMGVLLNTWSMVIHPKIVDRLIRTCLSWTETVIWTRVSFNVIPDTRHFKDNFYGLHSQTKVSKHWNIHKYFTATAKPITYKHSKPTAFIPLPHRYLSTVRHFFAPCRPPLCDVFLAALRVQRHGASLALLLSRFLSLQM